MKSKEKKINEEQQAVPKAKHIKNIAAASDCIKQPTFDNDNDDFFH